MQGRYVTFLFMTYGGGGCIVPRPEPSKTSERVSLHGCSRLYTHPSNVHPSIHQKRPISKNDAKIISDESMAIQFFVL